MKGGNKSIDTVRVYLCLELYHRLALSDLICIAPHPKMLRGHTSASVIDTSDSSTDVTHFERRHDVVVADPVVLLRRRSFCHCVGLLPDQL